MAGHADTEMTVMKFWLEDPKKSIHCTSLYEFIFKESRNIGVVVLDAKKLLINNTYIVGTLKRVGKIIDPRYPGWRSSAVCYVARSLSVARECLYWCLHFIPVCWSLLLAGCVRMVTFSASLLGHWVFLGKALCQLQY